MAYLGDFIIKKHIVGKTIKNLREEPDGVYFLEFTDGESLRFYPKLLIQSKSTGLTAEVKTRIKTIATSFGSNGVFLSPLDLE